MQKGEAAVVVVPQIAIAIGVLTSNTGATNHFGRLDVAPGCDCRVPSEDVVPLLCHRRVPL